MANTQIRGPLLRRSLPLRLCVLFLLIILLILLKFNPWHLSMISHYFSFVSFRFIEMSRFSPMCRYVTFSNHKWRFLYILDISPTAVHLLWSDSFLIRRRKSLQSSYCVSSSIAFVSLLKKYKIKFERKRRRDINQQFSHRWFIDRWIELKRNVDR